MSQPALPGLRDTEDHRPLPLAARVVVILIALAAVPVGLPSGYGLLWVISYASVGVVLAIRRPAHPIGWLLLGLGWSLALLSGELDLTPSQFTDGSLTAVEAIAAWVLGASGLAAFTLFAVLLAVFPAGRLPTGRWGAVLRVAIGIDLAISAMTAFAPEINVNMPGYPDGAQVRNPFAIAPDTALWDVAAAVPLFFIGIGILVLAAASLVIRARRSSGIERQQLRWVAASVGALVVTLIGGLVAANALENGLFYVPSMFAFAALPVSIGIAVLRHRLYEIDRIISRTIGWAMVTGILVAVFAALVVGLQALLARFTQGETLAVAASTLVAATLFQPVRRRVQHAVDHRFDRARYDGERIASAFAARLRDEVDLGRIRSDTVIVVVQTVRPTHAAVWLREGPG